MKAEETPNIQFILLCDEEKQQILSLEKLESENICVVSLLFH